MLNKNNKKSLMCSLFGHKYPKEAIKVSMGVPSIGKGSYVKGSLTLNYCKRCGHVQAIPVLEVQTNIRVPRK